MSRIRVFTGIIIIAILSLLIWRAYVQVQTSPADPNSPAAQVTAQSEEKPTAQETETVAEGEGEKQDPDAKDKDAKQKNGNEDGEKQESDDDTGKDDSEKMEAINLNNVEMKQIIKQIAEWTGKAVIPYDDNILKQKLTIYSTKELPRRQALSLIYSAMLSKGYVAEESDNVIYLKPAAKAKLGSIPMVSANEPLAKLVDKSQIVEKFFKVENYSPIGLQEIITPLIAEYGHVTSDENSNTLVVIDTVENLMRIERIIKQLDTQENEQLVTEVFELAHGDPAETVQLIRLLLSGDTRKRGGAKSPKPSASGKGSASSVIVTSEKTPLTLIPEPRRKWIIAKGSADDIAKVGKWIEKLDTTENVHAEQSVVQIKFVDVDEVARAVSKTLADMPGTQLKANVVVQPLKQARQIIIFGSEENRRVVENLIAEIDLPSSGMFEEKTFQLKYADADQIKENIEGLYGEEQSSSRYYRRRSNQKSPDTVKVIAYPTLSKVTIIASAENIEKISNQVREWDVPLNTKKQQYEILSLNNSDPVKMAELLATLFSEKQQRQMPWWWDGGGSSSKKKIVGSLYGKLSFEAVPDTKKIIVISKIPEAYDVIKKLVTELDRQEMAEVPKVITLKYADSEDLCEQLNAILNESGTQATIRRSQRGLSDYNNSGDAEKTTSKESSNNTAKAETIQPWWNSGVARRKSDSASPTSNLIGKIRFIPVQRSKAILVLAPPEYMNEISSMVEQLDKPGKQVMIKAIIVAVDHSSMTSLGAQISSNPGAFGDLGESAVMALSKMTSGFDRGSFSLAGSSDIYGLVDFLVKNTNGRILNQPTLWTKDNQEATFFKGQRVAFIESNNTSSEGTATKSQFDYRRVGVTLRVRPNITPEKAVDTIINLSISQVEPDLLNNNIATSELDTTTHVIVNNGDTVMLGGILFQQDTQIQRKFPLLGDLPLLGGLFQHNDNVVSNSELIVFITPYVVEEGVGGVEAEKPFEQELKKLDKTRKNLRKSVGEMMSKKKHSAENAQE